MLPDQVINVKDDNDEEDIDEMEFYAWNELRLHPLLMKAIYKLGFKEPMPIQKACIPAATHEGKVSQGFASGNQVILIQMICVDDTYCLFTLAGCCWGF